MRPVAVFGLALMFAAPLVAQPVARPVAAVRADAAGPQSVGQGETTTATRLADAGALGARRVPRWVRWGLAGAAAGAVAMPLLASLASDTEARPARDAAGGALAGFVIVGGSIALWDAVCAGDTRSRRAGLCGRGRGIPARFTFGGW